MKCGPGVSCVDYFPMKQYVREGSNLLTRPWQVKDDDRKHGRDRSVAEWRPRPLIGRDACDQQSFPKVTLLIFFVFVLMRCQTLQVPLCT